CPAAPPGVLTHRLHLQRQRLLIMGRYPVVDLRSKAVKDTRYTEICAAMKNASETYFKGNPRLHGRRGGFLGFIHDTHSSIFDAAAASSSTRTSSSSSVGMITSGATATAPSIS